MTDSKYGKFLTILLIIVAIGVLILLGFLGYDVINKYMTEQEVSEVLGKFNESLNQTTQNTENTENIEIPSIETNTQVPNPEQPSTPSTPSKVTYKGYNVEGTIEIPAIDLKYPVLERTTRDSIEAAVAILYGPGLNQIGNTTIVGHNYRNGSFFGNNDKLQLGDKIYITDNSGTKIKYNIYNIYETTGEDSDFLTRETNGKREISLSTCTDNSQANKRLVIWAIEE